MGWKIVISPGTVSDPLAFSVDAKFAFNLSGRVHDDENGKVQFIEYYVEVDGDTVTSPASAVATSLLATMDQLKQYTPRNVYLVLDGVTKYTWLSNDCIGSPRILAFQTVDEDGNADSHWRYRFTVYIKQGGNLGSSVVELQTSLLIVKEQDQVIRKVWRAYAKARNIGTAMSLVLSFKPADKNLHEEIERFFQENAVRATWIWDLYKVFVITEEPVQYTGNGKSYIWDYAAGDGNNPPPPIIHLAANEITRITIHGVIRGTDPNSLKAPPAHFNANGTSMVRNEAEEENGFPGLEDAIKGIWKLPYMEVWYFTGPGKPPTPNHSDHQKPAFFSPQDGRLGAQ